jgi:hypothetical protein
VQVSAPSLVNSVVGDNCEERHQAVLAAARAERAARKALEALGAPQPGWTQAEDAAHRAQLELWLAASRDLGNALNRLKADSRPQIHVTRV